MLKAIVKGRLVMTFFKRHVSIRVAERMPYIPNKEMKETITEMIINGLSLQWEKDLKEGKRPGFAYGEEYAIKSESMDITLVIGIDKYDNLSWSQQDELSANIDMLSENEAVLPLTICYIKTVFPSSFKVKEGTKIIEIP